MHSICLAIICNHAYDVSLHAIEIISFMQGNSQWDCLCKEKGSKSVKSVKKCLKIYNSTQHFRK